MIPVIIFNLVELVCTIVFGILLGTEPLTILVLLLTWMVARFMVNSPMHYKSAVKCFLMTSTMFISIYLATKVHIVIGILCVIFDNIILSKYGNISHNVESLNKDMFQWNAGNNRSSNYDDLISFLQEDSSHKLVLEYEEYWRENYPLRYDVFVMFFKHRLTYAEIRKAMDLKENDCISFECKIIYSTFERPLNLKPLAVKQKKK